MTSKKPEVKKPEEDAQLSETVWPGKNPYLAPLEDYPQQDPAPEEPKDLEPAKKQAPAKKAKAPEVELEHLSELIINDRGVHFRLEPYKTRGLYILTQIPAKASKDV